MANKEIIDYKALATVAGGDYVLTQTSDETTYNAPTISSILALTPPASTSEPGIVELATSEETTAGLAVQASDTRLSDARTPTAHAASHQDGGSDVVKATKLYDSNGVACVATDASGNVECDGDVRVDGGMIASDSSEILSRIAGFTNPLDHFTEIPSSPWLWATDAGVFDGTPPTSIIDGSFLRVASTGHYFLYRACSNVSQFIYMRCFIGSYTTCALRLDNGVGTEFQEFIVKPSSTGGVQIVTSDNGVETIRIDNLFPQYISLALNKNPTVSNTFCYIVQQSVYFELAGPNTGTMDISRMGLHLYSSNGASVRGRILVDWFHG